MIIRFELSTEFTRWEQRLDERNAASTGMKRYETGGEPSPSRVASSCQLSPHWHEASGSERQEKMLYSVAGGGLLRAARSISGISFQLARRKTQAGSLRHICGLNRTRRTPKRRPSMNRAENGMRCPIDWCQVRLYSMPRLNNVIFHTLKIINLSQFKN